MDALRGELTPNVAQRPHASSCGQLTCGNINYQPRTDGLSKPYYSLTRQHNTPWGPLLAIVPSISSTVFHSLLILLIQYRYDRCRHPLCSF